MRVSIHARRATGDSVAHGERPRIVVSIHARRATGDADGFHRVMAAKQFQFTPVVRRATALQKHLRLLRAVSIHARRATGDPRALA